jgi:hypothetical protein
MKTIAASGLVVLLVCLLTKLAVANDFKSQSFTGALPTIRVPGDRLMIIRNFTQDTAGTRGTVIVTPDGQSAALVLAAAIADPNAAQGLLETLNTVVVAGPANVDIACATGTCFISYRKEAD